MNDAYDAASFVKKATDVTQGGANPANKYATTWQKVRWLVTGWFACQFTGKGDRFAALIAQAGLETGGFSSAKWARGNGAWCMWYSRTGTPRATKADTQGEPTAMYTGAFRNVRMWLDRLAWDDRRGIAKGSFKTAGEYADQVLNAGWLGDGAVSRYPAYKAAWLGVYTALPSYVKAVGGAGLTSPGKSWMNIILWIVFIGVIGYILYLIWRWWKGRKR